MLAQGDDRGGLGLGVSFGSRENLVRAGIDDDFERRIARDLTVDDRRRSRN